MATDQRFRRRLFLAVLAGTMLAAGSSPIIGASSISTSTRQPASRSLAVRGSRSFPCRSNWSLFDGMRAGYVTAGNNADCGGRRGSLTLGVRLLRLDPVTKAWHTDKKRTRTFRNLRKNRYLEIAEHCAAATFRAVFRWTLR